jgi:predicted DNA-binding transcriptional regulator AlpA
MNLGDLASLPPTLSTAEAADLWGIGVDHLWKLAREGAAPVDPLRLGRALRWPTAAVLRSIGVDIPTDAEPSADVIPFRPESA